ncbi:hypothetical protein XENORESO_008163, partial [Xenotaenia resolanae]
FTSSTANLRVYLGRQSQQGSNPNEVVRTVAQVIIHKDFKVSTLDNDIALVKLSSAVTFTSYISPVCLAASDSTFYSDVDSWVTGWGNTGFSGRSHNRTEERSCSYSGQLRVNGSSFSPKPDGGEGARLLPGDHLCLLASGVVQQIISSHRLSTTLSQYQAWINSQITTNPPGFVTYTSTGNDRDLSVSCPGSFIDCCFIILSPAVVCGHAPLNTRIVGGGLSVTVGEWPWMASLLQKGKHVCGGTLVSEDAVLTNANCFSGSLNMSEYIVVLGRFKQNGANPFEVFFNVVNITLSNLTGSNIALLQLSTKPILNNYIQPVCLGNGRTFSVGSTCWATGWSFGNGGESNRPRLTQQCEQDLLEFKTTVSDCGNASVTNSMCTSQFALEQGDSGGPLMCEQDGSWFQVVVLSYVDISTRQNKETTVMVFENLNRFQDFLIQSLRTFLTPTIEDNTFVTNSTVNTTAATSIMATSGGSQHYFSWFLCWHLFVLTFCLQLFP